MIGNHQPVEWIALIFTSAVFVDAVWPWDWKGRRR